MLEGVGVAEAAMECGFSELSYFTRVFKKTLGILPSRVREETFTLTNQKR
jgi:AraC-like DNA-binding protein